MAQGLYRQAIITFIDILGFKEMVRSKSAGEVKRSLKAIRAFSGLDEKEDGDGYLPKTVQFSDSIIRIRPLDATANKEYPYGMLFHELNDIVLMQGELINFGVAIRGGITIGDISFDDQLIFGPGFIRAYELESSFAQYPRVVLDPKMIENMHNDERLFSFHNERGEELEYIRSQVRRGDDGLYFVDYLVAFPRNVTNQERIPEFFENSKKLIMSNVSGKKGLDGVLSKYIWLSHYHNFAVGECFERVPETEDMWVTESEFPLLAEMSKAP